MYADFCLPLPCLLALPTEAWRGAEIRIRSVENIDVILPGPLSQLFFPHWCLIHTVPLTTGPEGLRAVFREDLRDEGDQQSVHHV